MSSPFSNNTQSSGIYCRFSNGKVCRTAKEGEPGAFQVEKVDKDGKPTGQYKWEHQTKEVTGHIVGFRLIDGKFERKQFIIQMVHKPSGTSFNIQMNYGDRYWRAIATTLPNVNENHEVTFIPYDYNRKTDGKRMQGVGVYQGGMSRENQLPPAFTKDNTGGMPPMVKVKYQGKDRADFTDQDEWLMAQVIVPLNAKIKGSSANVVEHAADGQMDQGHDFPDETEDLPF